MSVLAPPDPPPVEDPELDHGSAGADPEALIEEARQRARRRRLRYAAATAVLAGIAVSLIIILGRSEPSHTASPALPALPPAGATPSTAEIVIHYDGWLPGTDAAWPPVRQLWVYADGRVIWRDQIQGADDDSIRGVMRGVPTGGPTYREQRLTPEGVELLRSEAISTGLFERDAEIGLSGLLAMQVRNGGRLVTVTGSGWGSPREPLVTVTGGRLPRATVSLRGREITRLKELLADPASWLPASAWQDRAIRAYVPSKYAICFWGGDGDVHPAQALSLLPPAAQDLLRGKDTAYQPLLVKPFGWVGPWPRPAVCSELTTTEAHALSGILSTAGFPSGRTWMNTDLFHTPDPSDTSIEFNPILPHGQPRGMLA